MPTSMPGREQRGQHGGVDLAVGLAVVSSLQKAISSKMQAHNVRPRTLNGMNWDAPRSRCHS